MNEWSALHVELSGLMTSPFALVDNFNRHGAAQADVSDPQHDQDALLPGHAEVDLAANASG